MLEIKCSERKGERALLNSHIIVKVYVPLYESCLTSWTSVAGEYFQTSFIVIKQNVQQNVQDRRIRD